MVLFALLVVIVRCQLRRQRYFASTVNSDGTQRALTVTNGTGDTTFSGAIGGSAPVKSLTITSDQLTAGAITLNGALTATLGGSIPSLE